MCILLHKDFGINAKQTKAVNIHYQYLALLSKVLLNKIGNPSLDFSMAVLLGSRYQEATFCLLGSSLYWYHVSENNHLFTLLHQLPRTI